MKCFSAVQVLQVNYVLMQDENRRPKARDSALIYAENRLQPWAKWVRSNRDKLGYPTISLLYKAMRQRSERLKIVRLPRITANGHETHSFIPEHAEEIPVEFAEVDRVVARLPKDLNEVIITDYFTYGPIEVRCKQTRWRRARYSQLLEAAKYAVFAGLAAISDDPSRSNLIASRTNPVR